MEGYSRKIKNRINQFILKKDCIDNDNLHKHYPDSTIYFENEKLVRWSSEIISVNRNKKIQNKVKNIYSQSYVTEIQDALIQTPYGFAYTPEGKLICPANWPLKMLLDGFPIKNFIHADKGQKTKKKVAKVFYLIGPQSFNYYHWLTDKITSLYEYKKYLEYDENCLLLYPMGHNQAFEQILSAFEIEKECLLPWDHTPWAVEKLVCCSSNKSLTQYQVNNPDRIRAVRDRLIHKFGESIRSSIYWKVDKVFITREDAEKNRSRIDNGLELSDFLDKRGFTPVSLTGLSFVDQVALFQNTKIIVGLHGAGLTNLMFSDPGTRVIEILPLSHHPRFYRDISDIFALDHKTYVVKSNKEQRFKVELNDFEKYACPSN